MNVILVMLGGGESESVGCINRCDLGQVCICKHISVGLTRAHKTEIMPTAREWAVPHLVEHLLV